MTENDALTPPDEPQAAGGAEQADAAGVPAGAAGSPAPAAPAAPETPDCPGGQIVEVQPGDTLFLIAQRFGVPLAAVILANPQITNPDQIVPGQRICVPSAPPRCPGGQLVVVEPGDTLFRIGQRFGVPVEAMIAANPQLENPNVLQPGQIVCVPRSPSACTGQLYVVQPGDTLSQIAQRFDVSLNALIAANPQITNPDRIAPGEVVCVPAATGTGS